MEAPHDTASIAEWEQTREQWGRTRVSDGVKRENEQLYLPVAEIEVVVEAPGVEIGDVASALPAVPAVAADILELAVVPPATVLPPAMVELADAVALAGQLAADGKFTFTLCRVVVSTLGICISQAQPNVIADSRRSDLRIT